MNTRLLPLSPARKFPRILSTSIAALFAGVLWTDRASAATVYWDINGTGSGATDSATGDATGIWNSTNPFFNPNALGTDATAPWVSGDVAVFSAGTNATGTFTVTVEGTQDIAGLTFEEGTVTLAGGTLNLSAATQITALTGRTATINSNLSGSAALTVGVQTTGNGTVIFGADNTGFTGTVNLNAGIARLLTNSGLGTNTITLGNTAAVLELGDGVVLANAITVSNTGNEKTIRAFAGTVVVNSVITQNENTTLGNFRLEANTGATLTVNSDIGGTVAGLRTLGAGTKILNGNNSYAGNTQILGGVTVFSDATNLGSTATVATIQIGTGATAATLRYVGDGDNIADALSLLGTTGGATLDSSGTGALIFSNAAAIVAGAGAKTLTLTGTNTDENRIDGIIQNNSAVNITNVSKTGVGTWVLTGNNAFNNTTVNGNGGILRVTGIGRIGAAALTVNAGTLDVAGTVNQTITTLALGGGAAGSSATINLGAGRSLILGGNVTFSATNNNLTSTITGGAGAQLDFGGAGRTFTIADSNTASPDLLIGANVELVNDGGGGLTKAGTGTLQIDGTNSLTGPVTVTGGGISGNLGAGNLLLNGGVFEGSGTFTRALGAGANQVQFGAAGGGFAANGGPLSVTFAGAPDPLVWGATPFFVPTTGTLFFGSLSANDVVTFTHNIDLNSTGAAVTRTVSVTDNTAVTTDRAVLSGLLSNSNGPGTLAKAGTGILELTGANTFTGDVNVTGGRLQFATVSDVGGGPSNLGQGAAFSLGGGTLEFIGGVNDETDRPITVTANNGRLDASGTGAAVFTYDGSVNGQTFLFELGGTGFGVFNAAITQTGTAADLEKEGTGTWRIDVAQPGVVDDFILNGGTLILNAANVHQGDDIFVRVATLILGVNGAVTNATDDLNISTDTASGGVLDINGTTGSAPTDINLGVSAFTGSIIDSVGGGSIGATGSFSLRNGTVAASLTGAGILNKISAGTVTISRGASFTGATTVTAGNLILDYTADNTERLSNTTALAMNGGTLTINGNATAPTLETVGSFTISAGASQIVVNSGAGQTATLDLNAFNARAVAGTVNFTLPANGSIQTDAPNGAGAILAGYTTVGGTNFATVVAGAIVPFTSTPKDDVATWLAGEDLTDAAGFAGATGPLSINSLRFGAAAASTVTINDSTTLNIASGGILVTPSVGAGTPSITGGFLTSGLGGELVVLQNSATSPFTIASMIVGESSEVTKSGVGMLVLSGPNNDFAGQTTINEGTLRLAGGFAVGDRSFIQIKDAPGVIFDVNGTTETIGGLNGGGTDGGLVTLGGGTLIMDTSVASRTYIGVITGTGSLVKNGPNSQVFQGDNVGFTGTVQINQGLVQANGGNGSLRGATAFTVNGLGELLSDQDQAASEDRIGNAAAITLNNTAVARGLWLRNNNQDSTRADTVGAITIGAGHNVIAADTNGGTNAARIGTLTSASLTRANRATLLVRGQNLGLSVNNRGQIIFTAVPAGIVGGGGLAGTTTMSIAPYIIGESVIGTDATLADNFGNSFVFNTGTTNGLRPLDLNTEYILNEAGYNALTGVTTNNVRFAVSPAAALTGGSKSINALVLDSSAAAMTVSGAPADTLTITSGGLLGTTTVAANAITLDGFAGIQTGAGNEYLIYVTTPASTFTINSPLNSGGAALIKSGAGTLVLTNGGNTYGLGTWFNQGAVEVANLTQLGTGGLNFYGGTLRFGGVFDPSARTVVFGTGGATFDTGTNDIVIANAMGGPNQDGGLTKLGAGLLTLNAAANYTGDTSINAGSIVYGVANALPTTSDLTLNGGNLNVGAFGGSLEALNVLVSSTITGSAPLTFTGNVAVNGGAARTLTVTNSGLTTFTGDLFTLVDIGTTARTFTLAGAGDVTIDARITNGTGAGSLTLTRTGVTTLNSANSYSGTTTINSGTVRITNNQALGSAAGGTAIAGTSAVLELANNITVTGETFTLSARQDVSVDNAHIRNISGNNELASSINFTTGGSSYNIDSEAGSLEISGQISGATTTGARSLRFRGAGNGEVSGNIVNGTATVGVSKEGVGTWLLSGGANAYTGPTVVVEGALVVTGVLTGTASVSVEDGGTLAGTGSINTAATITVLGGGTLSPGTSPGTLSTGSVNLSATTSTLRLELGGTAVGAYDQVAVTGSVMLGGTASISLFGAFVGAAQVNDTFFVILNDLADPVMGTFANESGGLITGTDGSQFAVNYGGGDGNDVQLTLMMVPEPGALVSLLGGLGMLAGLQRFRRRR